MATTALVVEILVAGLLATVWIVGIPILLLFPVEAERLVRGLLAGSSFSLLLGLGVLALAYPLGWLVNAVTSGVALITYRKPLQRRVFGNTCTPDLYRNIRVMLLMSSQAVQLTKSLEADTAVQRVARSAGLNFMVIGTLLLALSESFKGRSFGGIFFMASVIFWWIAIYYHATSYLKIKAAATWLPEGRELLAAASHPLDRKPDAPPYQSTLEMSVANPEGEDGLDGTSPNQGLAPDDLRRR